MSKTEIIKADYLDKLVLRVWFNDNTSKDIDFSVFLEKHPHPQHDRFKTPRMFKTYTIRNGNLIWGKHADLSFPIEALYTGNLEYTD